MWTLKSVLVLAITLGTLGSGTAVAQLYSVEQLDLVRRKMAPQIKLMVTKDIVDSLPSGDRAAASKVEVSFPERGSNPLAFWAISHQSTIYSPLESVRFFDDLAILFAWFERHGCAGENIQAYLYGLLRQGRPFGPPLATFGIDHKRALADHYVDDVSGKILKSGILFLMGHEMGHLLLRHQAGQTGQPSQHQEMAADSFSLDIFSRIGAPPGGAVIYFLAGRWRDPVGASVWKSTHPVSSDRVAAVADRLLSAPRDFSFAEPNRERGRLQVEEIGREMARIAALTSDEKMLTLLPKGLERDFPASRFMNACTFTSPKE